MYLFNNGKVFKSFCLIFNMIIKRITEVIGKKVYTDSGDYFGEVEEVNLVDNKIDGWRIKVGGSIISLIGGARGVIIPHQFVKAINEIFLINKNALPSASESNVEEIIEDLV